MLLSRCIDPHAQGNSSAARRYHDALGQLALFLLSGWRALAAAADHFMRGTDMETLAEVLHEQAKAGGGHELFIARAVLQVRSSSWTSFLFNDSVLPGLVPWL